MRAFVGVSEGNGTFILVGEIEAGLVKEELKIRIPTRKASITKNRSMNSLIHFFTPLFYQIFAENILSNLLPNSYA